MEIDYEILNLVTAEDFYAYYKEAYKRRFGQPTQIIQKTNKSSICNEILRNCINKKILPSGKNLVEHVMSSRYFILSKPETICLASLTVISTLMDMIYKSPIYSSHEWPICRKEEFSTLCLETIQKCDSYAFKSSKETFFIYFLKSVQNTYIENQRRLWEGFEEDYDGDEGYLQ